MSTLVQDPGLTLRFLIYKSGINLHRDGRTKDKANNLFDRVSDTKKNKKDYSKHVLVQYYVPTSWKCRAWMNLIQSPPCQSKSVTIYNSHFTDDETGA